MSAGAARSESLKPEPPDEPGLPVIGEVLAGKYLIERRLGSGGMGIVVAARNILLDDPVAIKFLRPSAATDDESVHRFVLEAKSANRIQSDHVVRVHDVSYLEIGTPYIIMELLEGEDLGQLVESRGVLSVTDAVDYICEACSGIAEAHALGIVHRDIKLANMFLTRRNDGTRVVKVLDFGIAKAMETGSAAQNPNMTDTRATFGSPTYMSPEQIRSAKRVDFRTDIWSLGVCLHEVLTARPPFVAETVAGLLASIIADPPVPIRQERPDIPADVEAAILRCLEKDLSRRFQTVGELVSALRPFASSSAEGSISRVMRLSPPSYPGSVSMIPSARGVTTSDAYPVSRAHAHGPTSSMSAMLAGEPVAAVSGPATYGSNARTERNFDTSRSNLAASEARTESARPTRALVAVALSLGVVALAGVVAGVGLFRHRLAGVTAVASGTSVAPIAPIAPSAPIAIPVPSAAVVPAPAPPDTTPAQAPSAPATVVPTGSAHPSTARGDARDTARTKAARVPAAAPGPATAPPAAAPATKDPLNAQF